MTRLVKRISIATGSVGERQKVGWDDGAVFCSACLQSLLSVLSSSVDRWWSLRCRVCSGHPWYNESNVASSAEKASRRTRTQSARCDDVDVQGSSWVGCTDQLVNCRAWRHRQTSIDYTPIMRPLNLTLPPVSPRARAPARGTSQQRRRPVHELYDRRGQWRTDGRTVRLITSRWRNATSTKLMTLIITCGGGGELR